MDMMCDAKNLTFFPIVGVHCTHGYNRTGFLIISYLVEVEDWRLVKCHVTLFS